MDKAIQFQNRSLTPASRDEVISLLTHELRAPLTAAKTFAEMITRHADRPAFTRQLSRKIVDALDRSEQMITDVLDAQRLRAGEKLEVRRVLTDLGILLTGLIEEFSVIHGDRFRLICEGTMIGNWDGRALRRAFENLLLNAAKFGENNTPIIVTAIEWPEVLEIFVKNYGNELSAPQEIFGQSLGLLLVKGIAESHGGHVTVESMPGKGTTFKISLPK